MCLLNGVRVLGTQLPVSPTVACVQVPYASQYGTTTRTNSRVIDFIIDHMGNRRAANPEYVFDTQNMALSQSLNSGLLVTPYFDYNVTLAQLYMGARGSGAFPHFHEATYNTLVFGVKHWVLFPPEAAFFQLKHARTWFEEDYPVLREAGTAMYECMQHSGEIMFIPHLWGHAVVNVRDSIGAAFSIDV